MSVAEALRISFRVAELEDAEVLRGLIERSVRGLGATQYSTAQIDGALGHALGLDTQLLEDGTYFCAVLEQEPKRLVGCGGWSWRRTLFGSDHGPGREMGALDPARDAAKIRAIFVDPAWAGQGVGRSVLRHCEAAALAAGFRRFEMGSTLTGYGLYLREGYVEMDRVWVPLPNGESLEVVRMGKTLAE